MSDAMLMKDGLARPTATDMRGWLMRGEVAMAAVCGAASGTRMTSMRKRAEFGSFGSWLSMHPGSSSGERTPDEPDT